MANPKVSIIMPTWNREKIVGDVIESIIAQTFQDWELIISDDGSTDKTSEVVLEYCKKDSRIKFFQLENKKCPAWPRNNGFKKVSGEFIAFCDSDDKWALDKLEIQLKALEKSGLKACCTGAVKYHPSDEVFDKYFSHKHGNLTFEYLLTDNGVVASSMLVASEIIKKIGLMNETQETRGAEDYSYWLRVALFTDIEYIDKSLVYYREDSGNNVSNVMLSNPYSIRRIAILDLILWLRTVNLELLNSNISEIQIDELLKKKNLDYLLQYELEDILQPCVSVVIPAFNCEKFIPETLESVRNQSMRDWEIIIVDDSSTDNSVEVIKKFIASESRTVKLVKNKYVKGIAGSLNTAIELAEGKYIARLDADDLCKNDRFEKQIRFMEDNNLDICGSSIEFFDSAKGKFIYPVQNYAIRSKILIETPFAHPSVMFHIEKLMKSDLKYDESFKGLEDVDLWSRLMKNKEFVFGNHPEVLLKYRVHKLQKSRTDSRTLVKADMEKVIARLLLQLDLQLSVKEMDMYLGNWYEQSLKDLNELSEFKKLLEKIYNTNINKKIFNDEYLREYLCIYWFKACRLFSKVNKQTTKDILVSIEIPNDWYKFNRSMLKYFVKDYLLRLTHK